MNSFLHLKEKRNAWLLLAVSATVLFGAVFFGRIQSAIAAVLQPPAVEVCVGSCYRESTVYCPAGYAETGFGGWNDGDQNLTGATAFCRQVGASGLEGDTVQVCSGECRMDNQVHCPDGYVMTVWGAAVTLKEFNRPSGFCMHLGANGLDGTPILVCGASDCRRESTVTCPDGYVVTGWGGAINGGGDLDRASSFCTKIPSTGTVNLNATLDGAPWSGPMTSSFTYNGTWYPPVSFVTPYTSGQTTPTGTFALAYNSGGPSGATFSGITPSATQTLSAGGAITFTFNFVTATGGTGLGTVNINATLDGAPWSGPMSSYFTYNGTWYPPVSFVTPYTSGQTTPTGTFVLIYNSGGPPGATLLNNTPSAALTLFAGGTITFSFDFVTAALPSPTLVISPSSASVPIGGTQQFRVIYDSDGPGPIGSYDVTGSSGWTSSNTSVATIRSYWGLATGVSAGSATITASYSGLTASAPFTVTTPVPKLVITPSSATVPIGGTQQFSATYDSDGAGPNPPLDVTSVAAWASTDATKITVSSGLATRVGPGGYTLISASYVDLTADAVVLDSALSLSVSCSASPTSVATGQPVTWTASASGGTGSYSYSWSGSSPLGGQAGNPVTVSYATTGTKTGSVTVTSGSQSVTQSCSSSVSVSSASSAPAAPSSLRVDASSLNTCGAIRLTWTDNSNNEDNFEVERDSGSGFVNITNPFANATSFTDATIAQNILYSYRIRACNAIGCSAYSNTVTGANQSPSADFNWSPQTPQVNQPTLFTDISTPFGGATITRRQWTFQDGNPATAVGAATTTRFVNANPAQKSVALNVTDSLSRACSIVKSVTVLQGTTGEWCELPPESPPGTPCP